MSEAKRWRFTVVYEGEIEAPTADEARQWAEEEVTAGQWSITTSEVERIKRDGD